MLQDFCCLAQLRDLVDFNRQVCCNHLRGHPPCCSSLGGWSSHCSQLQCPYATSLQALSAQSCRQQCKNLFFCSVPCAHNPLQRLQSLLNPGHLQNLPQLQLHVSYMFLHSLEGLCPHCPISLKEPSRPLQLQIQKELTLVVKF